MSYYVSIIIIIIRERGRFFYDGMQINAHSFSILMQAVMEHVHVEHVL